MNIIFIFFFFCFFRCLFFFITCFTFDVICLNRYFKCNRKVDNRRAIILHSRNLSCQALFDIFVPSSSVLYYDHAKIYMYYKTLYGILIVWISCGFAKSLFMQLINVPCLALTIELYRFYIDMAYVFWLLSRPVDCGYIRASRCICIIIQLEIRIYPNFFNRK